MNTLLKKYSNFIVVLISIITSVFIAELVLRSVLFSDQSIKIRRPNNRIVLNTEGKVMPGVNGNSTFSVNSIGLRGDEIPENPVEKIFVLGGSTSECLVLDDKEAWPYLLQEKLNKNSNKRFWVGNGGVSGLNSNHHKEQLEYLLLDNKFKNLSSLILLVGVNDFLLFISDSIRYLNTPENKLRQKAMYYYDFDNYHKKTALYQLIRNAYNNAKNLNFDKNLGDKLYLKGRLTRMHAKHKNFNLPNLKSGLDKYEKNLNSIIDLTKNSGIELILLTQPTIWHTDMNEYLESLLWMGWKCSESENCKEYYSPEVLSYGMNKFNQKLKDIAKENNVACIDLAAMISKDSTSFYDDCHFNENGSRKVGEILSDYFNGKN